MMETGISKGSLWTGRILSWLVALFFLMDGTMKLVKPQQVVEATVKLGYPESAISGIGVVLLISTLLYLVPRTAVLGAVLLTAYMGGAVATHVRVSAPVFNVVFSVLFGVLVWLGLWLRDRRLQALLPVSGN